MTKRQEEVTHKLQFLRQALMDTAAQGVRLRGTDWFAWATAGASNTVLLAAETGIAEVLVTPDAAWILTDDIEAQRLLDEELQEISSYQLHIAPWAEPAKREQFVQKLTQGKLVLSDRPTSSESSIPSALLAHKRTLLGGELDRYRHIGKLASEAMTEVLTTARPDWTELELAGAGARALWARGLHPTLILAAGEHRLYRYRHPTPTATPIGHRAMLVFCARGFGLYANLTRFVAFGALSAKEQELHRQVREIEAAALDQCQLDVPLHHIYDTLKNAYEQQGYPQAIREHHQGGTTGYLAREIVANPETRDRLTANTALAWNPSLAGAKIEDTFVLHEDASLENLTVDPNWISTDVAGRSRPLPFVIE